MEARKSTVLSGSAEWPPTLWSFSQVMHPQALRHLDSLPVYLLGSALFFPLFPSAGLKKAVTSLQTSWERLSAATWVMEAIPVSLGNSSSKHLSKILSCSKPFLSPAKGSFPSLLLWGGGCHPACVPPHVFFHTQFLFCMISAWPGVRFLCVSRKRTDLKMAYRQVCTP